jgi:hypothetical protein
MSNLIGGWILSFLIYQGQQVPPFRPNIEVYYLFQNENENQLFYYDKADGSHCHRSATYQQKNHIITQKVIQVDAENHDFCSNDTDMLMNNLSEVQYDIIDNQLHLFLQLGDEPIQYIFDRKF